MGGPTREGAASQTSATSLPSRDAKRAMPMSSARRARANDEGTLLQPACSMQHHRRARQQQARLQTPSDLTEMRHKRATLAQYSACRREPTWTGSKELREGS